MPPKSSVPAPADLGPQRGFEDLDRLKNVDGLVAIISRRLSNGVLTFSIQKEFDRDGFPALTSFIPESLIDSYLDLVSRATARVRALRVELGPVRPAAASASQSRR